MTLKQKELVSAAVLIAGLLLILLCGKHILFWPLGLAVALGSVVLWKRWWRCPNCGQFLGRTKGRYCPHCGKEIDYDTKKSQ
ncbi:hypothetical protein [uncultured Oscillibacter sp.]|uniref:hypothetical protein n=1 Tax=uncultured Oscillibacter sp. TaxID=876091 RepID=UPI002632EAF7|nr:hypothetical protein [uncultured Oscillibacter sp.]